MNALPTLARFLARLQARLQSGLQAWLRSRRWQVSSGIALVLVTLLISGLLMVRQRQLAATVRPPATTCARNAPVTGMLPPGVTLPVKIPTGEPLVVATVNGYPLCAEGLELRVEGILANHQQALQQMSQGAPPSLLATLKETPNQVRHDALTQMIQERLLLQEGKRLGLTASESAAQAMARQQLRLIDSAPASSPARVQFEAFLRANHLTEQTYPSDPDTLSAYADLLTIQAMRQRIEQGLPPSESSTDGINAYVQHLWQTGAVHVYLPAQFGWYCARSAPARRPAPLESRHRRGTPGHHD